MIYWIFAAVAALGFFKKEEIVGIFINGNQFDELFKKYAALSGFDWKVLKAISMNESGLGLFQGGAMKSILAGLENPKNIEGSKSSDGKSWGIMQVTLTTAKDYDPKATAEKLNDPEYSIRIASMHLSRLSNLFPKVELRYIEWVIKSYNQGQGNTAKERSGSIAGYAQEYWERYQRNFARL